MAKLMRLLRTVRHLRTRQIVDQFTHRFKLREGMRGRTLRRSAPPDPGAVVWQPRTELAIPLPPKLLDGEEIRGGRWRFVGESHAIGFPPEWHTCEPSLLWRYNLHYFEYLWRLEPAAAQRLCEHWIEHNPVGVTPGWDAYPISLRLGHWCAYWFGVHQGYLAADSMFERRLRQSVAWQRLWLRHHLETHLLANHLFENVVALCVYDACFGRSRDCDATGLLQRELKEQVLSDGMHYERSPMYQQRLTWSLLMLKWTGDQSLGKIINEPLRLMLCALATTCHPDRQIALLNDAAFDIYPTPVDLFTFAAALGLDASPASLGSFALPEAGYYGVRTKAGDYLIVDAGPIGPVYQPGHGHADLLSFELSLAGQRVITDSGNHDYLASAERRYCRSTAAHNTVEIDGFDQVELWGAFRVGRRGRVTVHDYQSDERGFVLVASHDGYCYLPGRPRHERRITWRHDGRMEGHDRIVGGRGQLCKLRLHFHPEVRCEDWTECSVRLVFGERGAVLRWRGTEQAHSGISWYCPQFGRRLNRPMIALTFKGDSPGIAWSLEWNPPPPSEPTP